ncbi:MAG: hypothetical protein OXK76_20275 [Gammaproteobacteria bacterium]|nr:hypothetical protein [Gammaproteobacteria bacterium]
MTDTARTAAESDYRTYRWYDQAVVYAAVQYECRRSARIATRKYVAMIAHALRSAGETAAGECFRSLVDDAKERQFAFRSLSRIVEGDRRACRPLPPAVEAWQRARWRLDEHSQRPKRPRKGAEKRFLRDLDIYEIVELVVRLWEVTATRNPESDVRQSACDIVAEALGMSYEAVASIHNRHPKSPVRRYHSFLRALPGVTSWDIRTIAEDPLGPDDRS